MTKNEDKLKFIKCLRESDKKKLSDILTDRIINVDNMITSRQPEKNRTIRSLSDELDTALTIRDIITDIPIC